MAEKKMVIGAEPPQKRDWNIFFASVFFVLGFAFVFSLLGVLLQTVLAASSEAIQTWLGRIGGVIIIFFGLYLLGVIRPKFLEKEHKFKVRKFKSMYLTSFVFGVAFAVGWTPCVTAALGAILGLAASAPSSAFILLFAYTLGLGVPFLLVGLFTNQAQAFIQRSGKWLDYFNKFFGLVLIAIGVLVFVNQLRRIANLAFLTNILIYLNVSSAAGGGIGMFSVVNLGVAFFAGLVSFLSPCVLPLIPAFLSYLGSIATKK